MQIESQNDDLILILGDKMMSTQLIRLVYASKATFKPFAADQGIDKNVASILATARRENKRNNLVGALYYGNGCFFQCLEGTREAIDALYAKLQKDPRHTQLQILSTQPISQIGFSSWEMKYATIDQEVRSFLRRHQMGKFDPYRFTPDMSAELVDLLQSADEGINEAQLAAANVHRGGVSMKVLWITNLISIALAAFVTQWVLNS